MFAEDTKRLAACQLDREEGGGRFVVVLVVVGMSSRLARVRFDLRGRTPAARREPLDLSATYSTSHARTATPPPYMPARLQPRALTGHTPCDPMEEVYRCQEEASCGSSA